MSTAPSSPSLLILGCGFTGVEAGRQALVAGRRVLGTTRAPDRLPQLRAWGFDVRLVPALTADVVRDLWPPAGDALVTFAPDGVTDAAVAPAWRGQRVVYISTTGVFGGARGRVDEQTPVDASEPRAAARLAAEALYLRMGGVVLRAAGIYGPGRGLHRRVLDRSYRIPGAGTNVVSRIHVSDLARVALAALASDEARWARLSGRAFVVADDAPVPQIEVIRWLVDILDAPMPEAAPLEQVSVTLRHDRAVDNSAIKRELGLALAYPTYREGFAACFAAEGLQSTRLRRSPA